MVAGLFFAIAAARLIFVEAMQFFFATLTLDFASFLVPFTLLAFALGLFDGEGIDPPLRICMAVWANARERFDFVPTVLAPHQASPNSCQRPRTAKLKKYSYG